MDILRGLTAEGAAIAVVLHDLNLAVASVDRIVLVGDGTVIADGPVERVFRTELLSRAYGAEIAVTVLPDRTPAVLTATGTLLSVVLLLPN